jgi:hypothetical protein
MAVEIPQASFCQDEAEELQRTARLFPAADQAAAEKDCPKKII